MIQTITDAKAREYMQHGQALAARQEDAIRADSRRSEGPGVATTRAILRAHAIREARRWASQRADDGIRTDEREVQTAAHDYVDALSGASGLRVDGDTVRADSVFFANDLTSRDVNPYTQPAKPYALTEAIPSVSVDAWAMRMTHIAASGNGKMATVNPGDTTIPVISSKGSESGSRILTGAVKTMRVWGSEIFAVRSAINAEAIELEHARRMALEWREDLLAVGAGGVDAVGVATIALPERVSPNDYAGSVTMDAVRRDFVNFIGGLQSSAEYRVSGGYRLVIGPRLAAAAFLRDSNYAAGGSATSEQVLAGLRTLTAGMQLLGSIQSVQIAPRLAGVRGGADHDTALALSVGAPTVQQGSAIGTLTPVHTYDDAGGRATIWIVRHSALDLVSTLGAGLMIAKVA